MSFVQTGRLLKIDTPLGGDALLLAMIECREGISQLFELDLDLRAEDDAIDFGRIVGENVTVSIELADGSLRLWNGYVSRFAQGTQHPFLTTYRATVVPWLWFLTRTTDCRIFQKKTAPEIVSQIFEDLDFKDFDLRLYGSFTKRDYCVQYRETDFNFVSRLMEEEGICYFFEHDKGKHTLVLANDPGSHPPVPNSKVRFHPVRGGHRTQDTVFDLRQEQAFRPQSYSATDFNFTTPGTNLGVSVPSRKRYDVYDYPGDYLQRAEGESRARIRLEEEQRDSLVTHGHGECPQFTPGFTYDLDEHPHSGVNITYLLTRVGHTASQTYEVGEGASGELTYENRFQCIPHSVPYRPERVTRRPVVQGCQTAIVVGPSGEEIYTDEYGRVKVQFHWDREGQNDEESSCWIRVSHPWAGKHWGALAIPRIGQEVIVDFLEGDPDQPIIVGRVYNGEQLPPFGLPDGAVVSGVRSDSTKGGGGYNQMSMDDTKGNELVHIHAQYDMDTAIEHDERVDVGNDRTEHVHNDESITIDNNRTESVGVNESITIGQNRTESVGVNENISVGSNRTEAVGGNETLTVTMTRTRNVGVNEMVNVGGAQEVTIGGLQALTVGAVRNKSVGGAENVDVGASQSVSIGSDQSVNVGKGRSVSVGADDALQVAKTLTVDAGDQIVIKTGQASIAMKKDGTVQITGKSITIDGQDITIKGSGKIDIKASKDIVLKGKKILQN